MKTHVTTNTRGSSLAVCAALLLCPSASTAAQALDHHSPAAQLSDGRSSPQLWAPPLLSPLRVMAEFDLPNGPYQSGHRGIDLPGAPGDTVLSPTAGTVSFVGFVVDRPVISIRVDERTVVSIEPVASEISIGATVSRGEQLGVIGEGGHCEGACIHLGVRVENVYVNPLRYFRARPVLLPW